MKEKIPRPKLKTKVRTMEVFKHLNSKYEIGSGEKTVDYNLKIYTSISLQQ